LTFLQVNALDDYGFGQNTILVFASDNGPELEAYERARSTGHFSMFHFRGLKRDLYEGGHRIPMIVRWPAVVAAGTHCRALFSLTDWLVSRYSTLHANYAFATPVVLFRIDEYITSAFMFINYFNSQVCYNGCCHKAYAKQCNRS